MKKKIIILIIIVLSAAAAVVGNLLRSRNNSDIPIVATTLAVRKALVETITATGSFEPETEEVHLSPRAARIHAVYKKVGDRVNPGDVILQIDDDDARVALQEAEIALEQVRRRLMRSLVDSRLEFSRYTIERDQALEAYNKQSRLFELEAVSEEELNLSRDKLATAEEVLASNRQKLNLSMNLALDAQPDLENLDDQSIINNSPEISSARLAVAKALQEVQDCRITASTSGFVVQIPAKTGSNVKVGDIISKVQSLDRIKARITIDEVDIGKIATGDKVELSSDSLLGKTVPGEISAISPFIETIGNLRASYVEVIPTDSSLTLRSGASCVARITTVTRESALTVPVSAVHTRKGKFLVFLLEDQGNKRYRVKEIEMESGLSTINDVEIISGVEEGDLLVTSDLDLMKDGLIVTTWDDE